MATIGTLAVNVVANTGGLSRGLGRARGQVQQFSAGVRGGTSSMGGFIAAIGRAGAAAAAVAGAYIAAKKSLQGLLDTMAKLDATAKTADRLGLTIRQLEQLRHAASLSGVDVSTLEMALQRMTRRISEAANGTGEAKNALRELGLDAAKLEAAGPAGALALIADAMRNLENPADRVRVAMKLFDSEGVKLVNMLNAGSEGLNQAADEVDQFNVALSRTDASTIEQSNDAIARMWKAIEGVTNYMGLMFAPAFKAAAEIVTDVANGVSAVLKPVLKLLGHDMGAASEAGLQKAGADARALKPALDEDAAAAEQLKKQMEDLASRGASLTASLRTPAEQFQATLADLHELVGAGAITWETYRRGVERATKELRQQGQQQRQLQRTQGVGAAIRGTADAFSSAAASIRLQRDMERHQKQQLSEAKKMNDILNKIESNTREQVSIKAVNL